MTSLAKSARHSPQQHNASLLTQILHFTLATCAPLFAAFAFFRVQLVVALADIIHLLAGNKKRRDDNVFLKGNYAPVYKEVHEQNLPVEGNLPQALDGVFVRTGPNPYFLPRGDYHWFDGDGMLHACRIKNGSVTYCNKFVDTFKLAQEKQAGAAIIGKFGDLRGIAGFFHLALKQLGNLLGLGNTKHGLGTGNTALVYHAQKLMTLHEGDLPYAARILCNGLIESLGRVEFDGKLDHPFTAHPKLDHATGELFFIGYQMDPKQPRLWYAGLDSKGDLMFDQCVHLKHAVMHHDFAISQNHALIIDHCLEFNGKAMTEGNLPFKTNYQRNARIGVLPKRPQDPSSKVVNVRWFELDRPFAAFHTANAWEDGDVIRLFLCYFKQFELTGISKHPPAELCEIRLNLRTGSSELISLQPGLYCDFPRIRQDLLGKPSQYAFAGVMKHPARDPQFIGVAKFDLMGKGPGKAVVGQLSFGPDKYGGEAFFVPANQNPSKCEGDDDGYLVTFVHDESATSPGRGTAMVVYDAKTMSNTPLARVPLPQRVPYGFHCHHMNEAELQEHLQVPPQNLQLAKPNLGV